MKTDEKGQRHEGSRDTLAERINSDTQAARCNQEQSKSVPKLRKQKEEVRESLLWRKSPGPEAFRDKFYSENAAIGPSQTLPQA